MNNAMKGKEYLSKVRYVESGKIIYVVIIFGVFLYILVLNVYGEGARSSYTRNIKEIDNKATESNFAYALRRYKRGSIYLKRAAVQTLGKYKNLLGIKVLIEALGHRDYAVSYYAKESLIGLSSYAYVEVYKALELRRNRSRNEKRKQKLIEVLGGIGDRRCVGLILKILSESKSGPIRLSCIKTLGLLGAEGSIDRIIKSMQSDADWQVRAESAKVLGKLKAYESIKPLLEVLEDSNNFVKLNVVWSLGKLRSVESVPYLIKYLGKGNSEVRETVAWALGMIGDKRAVKPLLYTLFKDPSLSVRRESRLALLTFGYSSEDLDGVYGR